MADGIRTELQSVPLFMPPSDFWPAAVLLLRAARLDAGLRPCNAAAGDGTPPFSLPT